MKKVILASLLMAGIIGTATAQKGSFLLYGNVGVSSSKSEPFTNKYTTFSLNPGVGYQFSNNWTLGLAGGVQSSKNETGTIENKQTAVAVGPFIRYTKSLSPTFFFFSQLDAQYSSRTYKSTPGGETKYSGFNVGVTPAIGAKVYKGLALNFSVGSLGYGTEKEKGSVNKTSRFLFSFGNQANFGVSVNL